MRTTSLTLILAGLLTGCATEPCSVGDNADGGVSISCAGGTVTVAPPTNQRRVDTAGPDLTRPLTDGPRTTLSSGAMGVPEGGPELPPEPGVGDTTPPAGPEADPGPVMVWAEPADEAACPNGGTAITTFTDNNRDGLPGAEEPQTTTYLCESETEKLVLVASRLVEPGLACVTGGSALVSGLDVNGDGVLADSEITERVVDCNPQPLSAATIPGYQVVTNTRSEFSVRASVDETVPLGAHLNWRVKLSEKASGAPIPGVQLAYDTRLGRGESAMWSMPVVTDVHGDAKFGPEVSFDLANSGFGGDNGAVMYFRVVTMVPGAYDVSLELVPEPHGLPIGRTTVAIDVTPR